MNRVLRFYKISALILLVFLASVSPRLCLAGGVIIPTDDTQADFTNAYKLMLYKSYVDYRFTSSTIDTVLFPKFGEFSIYWAKSGTNKGSFIMPDAMPSSYSTVTSSSYDNYDWAGSDHYSIQYKSNSKRVAIFLSDILMNNRSVSWEGMYFKNTFDSYLYNNIHYFLNEQALDTANISGATQLLIIPSFSLNGADNKYYIDSVFRLCPNLPERINTYLAGGGTIYAEGNAVYFIEKLGYLNNNAVNFDNQRYGDPNTSLLKVNFTNSSHPLSFSSSAVEDSLYAISVPQVDAGNAEVIANITGFGPVAFVLAGGDANGGRIICNTGLPTVGGINEIQNGSKQLVWTMNAIMSAFTKNIDVTRSVFNDLPDSVSAGKNAVSYDRLDTFEMRVMIRNLSSEDISGITIYEYLLHRNIDGKYKTYFDIVDVVTPGVNSKINGRLVTFSNISIPAHGEKTIVYRLKTPDPEDTIHEDVDRFIAWRTYVYGTYNVTKYSDNSGSNTFWKYYRNYIDIMFSANLVADTDVNWKNFLGLYYQPFKVFMIMENKERTSAENTVYTQYIPKDVPFYWSDKSINIPILKTPGGKFVDVLRGSNDEDSPDFDMDSDGHPDAWLDTASIYPKGYTITEESVYWLNPWEHMRSGDKFYYEDIDHDGKRAQDTDGDGVVDVEEPGDKIRVWKITWNINRVPGYDYADPYCYLELWVDPPELVKLSAGVGKAHSLLDEDVEGMFYPYTPDINTADLSDTTWSHWMERDENGMVVWKQLIYQSINNYEGFTFIDTAAQNYRLRPTDRVVGTVPQPHREFIAVLSLGGEEIDMTKYTPQQSLYSKLEYNTIFNEKRVTPIRSTYTYYAPLPNPLQFEYLSNNYSVTDYFTGDTLKYLPEHGRANVSFDIDASTEYTYYWIRNVGHDVDYNDPSEAIEGIEELGDGVFGYMVYDIPKGLGGYKITLPKKEDGSYDINSIVQVDGSNYKKWLDNPNTKNDIEIWEDPFQYHVYIPQLLIPPALDDDNFDGVDDWIDDRGDRFASRTGFLHDSYMLDDGEDWLAYPEVPFRDDIYGMVDSGWYHGADMTYGDDFFENLGKTHFKINVVYEGLGKEGPVEISKGGWLVVEEIFGGSPWVIFSHVLSGYAEGTDYEVKSSTNPSVVKFGNDTTFIKHEIYDANEPHYFDARFDPYNVSYGYGDATITAYVGGKDPCSLIDPPIQMPAIVDPDFDHKEITLIPLADSTNPELSDYPKTIEGTFIEVKVEVSNGTDDNWLFTTVTPQLPANLGNTKVAMSYVAYPRPLVPAKVDPTTGKVIMGGDDFGTFRTAWRFNQPEGEVIVKLGNELGLIQPSRRAYFIFLISIDENLDNGVYDIGFTVSGQRRHYDEPSIAKNDNQVQSAQINYDVPPVKFSVSDKNSAGTVTEYQKFIIGTGDLKDLKVQTDPSFTGLENVKWSTNNVNHNNFDDMTGKLASSYDAATGVETIDLSPFNNFPTIENNAFYLLQQGDVYSYNDNEKVEVSPYRELSYDMNNSGRKTDSIGKQIIVTSAGPKIKDYMVISGLNGKKIGQGDPLVWDTNEEKDIEVMFEVTNYGNGIAEKTILDINPGESFFAFKESLPEICTIKGTKVEASLGAFYPGQTKRFYVHFGATKEACMTLFDQTTIVPNVNIHYEGSLGNAQAEKKIFSYEDFTLLDSPVIDFNLSAITSTQPDISLGSYTKITAKFQNGVVNTEDVVVGLYAIVNHKDTMLVGKKLVPALEISGDYEFSMNYSIPPDAEFVEIFAEVDAGDNYNEICESNNYKVMSLPIQGPNWILKVKNFPNPFTGSTDFSYVLPREVRDVSITVYGLDGTIVDIINNCPNSYGEHSVRWENPVLAKGTYIYNIIGTNNQGEKVKYFGKIKKE